MPSQRRQRNVVVLAPMPLEMDAVVTAFGLSRVGNADDSPFTGRIGSSDVTAIHIGMGPTLTRAATSQLFSGSFPGPPVDHVMISGICGGLDPDLPVGTLINPEFVIEFASGAIHRHTPPGDAPQAGKLVTTENATLDVDLSRRFFEDGCVGVDMETSAVAEVCESYGCPWSAYRCIGDRYFDGLLDRSIVDATNPDGSGNGAEIKRLIDSDPSLAERLERLSRDTALAARLAAEAALRGCIALDSGDVGNPQ
jgi:adenosylhomocysteine nucleosidase